MWLAVKRPSSIISPRRFSLASISASFFLSSLLGGGIGAIGQFAGAPDISGRRRAARGRVRTRNASSLSFQLSARSTSLFFLRASSARSWARGSFFEIGEVPFSSVCRRLFEAGVGFPFFSALLLDFSAG